jgi:hypothetical protein
MNRRSIFLPSAVAVAWAVAGAMAANAETFSLQLKRLETVTGPPADTTFRGLQGQRFQRQIGVDVPEATGRADEDEFAKVITKEPSYNSKFPFRGVATLGTQKFGFVLDTDKPAPEAEGAQITPVLHNYKRLHFDLNGNGDLTDDPVIEALDPGNVRYREGSASFSFPRVDLTVDVEGTEVDYAFFFVNSSTLLSSNDKPQYLYVYASLNAAAYREGEITVDGQELRILVADFNSNGRFDDLVVLEGQAYLPLGDRIFVDPQPQERGSFDVTISDSQHCLSKTILINGRFYDLQIPPAGDKLTVKPSPRQVGHVSNPHHGYRGLVYGEPGVLKIASDADGRAVLPAGTWRLHSYTVDRTGYDQTEELADAVLGSSRPTRISARWTGEHAAFEVRPGETAEVQFGPPYTPRVSISYVRGDQVTLNLSLVGVGGEVCSSLLVHGGRPAKPAFTITDPDGKILQTGNFEYGLGFTCRYFCRVPSDLAEEYRVKVKMEAGPFKIDPDYESVLKPADWKRLGATFGGVPAR